MLLTMLKSKLHRVVCTGSELHYEGSCAIDSELLAAADILVHERVDVWNVTNGERFSTYAIAAASGSGIVSVNGSAARRAAPGDLLIVASFVLMEEGAARIWRPKLVFVDPSNRLKSVVADSAIQEPGL